MNKHVDVWKYIDNDEDVEIKDDRITKPGTYVMINQYTQRFNYQGITRVISRGK